MIEEIWFLAFYFFPVIVAAFRKLRKIENVFIVNLWAGWWLPAWLGTLLFALYYDELAD